MGSGRSGQKVSWPPKIWSSGQKLHRAYFLCCVLTSAFIILHQGPFPFMLHLNQHDLQGWGENQRITLHEKNFNFYRDPAVEKWFRRQSLMYVQFWLSAVHNLLTIFSRCWYRRRDAPHSETGLSLWRPPEPGMHCRPASDLNRGVAFSAADWRLICYMSFFPEQFN